MFALILGRISRLLELGTGRRAGEPSLPRFYFDVYAKSARRTYRHPYRFAA
jgi:hypothetical protein